MKTSFGPSPIIRCQIMANFVFSCYKTWLYICFLFYDCFMFLFLFVFFFAHYSIDMVTISWWNVLYTFIITYILSLYIYYLLLIISHHYVLLHVYCSYGCLILSFRVNLSSTSYLYCNRYIAVLGYIPFTLNTNIANVT